jgi:phosphoglucomutase
MKFYLFASERVESGNELPAAKQKTRDTLDSLRALIEADARKRAEG